MFRYQESSIGSLQQENANLVEINDCNKLDDMITKARDCHEKLVSIKRSMLILGDKTARLKRKASKLLEEKDKKDLERRRLRERREILEKHLEPVVNTRSDS